MRIYSKVLATSLSALVAIAPLGHTAAARNACFVFATNTVPTPIFSASAGSLSAAEASTSQVLEVLAERRTEAAPCPPGLTRINGLCVAQQVAAVTPVAAPPPQAVPVVPAVPAPAAPVVSAPPAPKAAPVAAPVASAVPAPNAPPVTVAPAAPTPAVTKLKAKPVKMVEPKPVAKVAPPKYVDYQPMKTVAVPPEQPEKTHGTWAEAFADRERRPTSRTRTAGIVVGFDRQFDFHGARLRLGGVGSYADVRTTSSTAGSSPQTVTFTYADDPNSPPDPPRTPFTSDLSFDNVTSSTAKIRTHGVGGGVTWSLARGSHYWDGLAKLDLFDLSSASTSLNSLGSLLPQDSQNGVPPDVFIYDGLGPNSDQRVYRPDGSFTEYASLADYQREARGCIIAGTDQTDPVTSINAKLAQLFAPGSSASSKSGSASLAVMTLANTFGYTRDLGDGYTLEPSAGFRYSYSHYYNDDASLGLRDGHVLRLEAGAKLSHLRPVGHGAVWSNSAGLYVYSDVLVNGFVVSTNGSSFKGDQGEVRLRGVLQSKIRFADGLQLYGEVNGRVGQDYSALGGKLGVRIEW